MGERWGTQRCAAGVPKYTGAESLNAIELQITLIEVVCQLVHSLIEEACCFFLSSFSLALFALYH